MKIIKILNEALDPKVQEQKMDGWHQGTYHQERTIDRMSDDKLEMNFDICRLKDYDVEAAQLERVGRWRNLSRIINPDPLNVVAKRFPMITPSNRVLNLINNQNNVQQQSIQTQAQNQIAKQSMTQPQVIIDRSGPRPVGKINSETFVLLEPDELDLSWATFVKEHENDVQTVWDAAMLQNGSIRRMCVALIFAVILKLSKEYIAELQAILTANYGKTKSELKQTILHVLSDSGCCEAIKNISNQLKESFTEDINLSATTPYMLRNDGKLLKCGNAHPYIKIWKTASFDDNYKNLISRKSDIDWFIQNTEIDEARDSYTRLKDNIENNVVDEAVFEEANNYSDQEFCRVRTSNFKYNYGGDNGEIYFRINSDGFNWFNIIWNVVNKFKNQIKFVTIMKDRIVRGQKLEYISDGKNVFNKMPVDEFLTLSGNPVVEDLEINEDIEKHDTLNPKLWNSDNTLKPEVDEKINQIVDEFITNLYEDEIDIKIDDIILIGSNCSYNYTKDSDLDIHIIANTAKSKYSPEAASKLYSAYRTIFNKNLDIDFYGIPVEIYVEDENSARISNGVYSVMNQTWIKEPVAEDIPEIDKEAFDKEFKVWEDRYNELISTIDTKLEEKVGSTTLTAIDAYINDVYALRKEGLAKDGEYSIGNLIFKEVRNKGYLDNLKELRNKLIGKQLSLESLDEEWYKEKESNFYELADRVSDLDDSMYKDEISLYWQGKSGGSEYDSSIDGVPVWREWNRVTFAQEYDRGRYKFKTVDVPDPGKGYKSSFEIRKYPEGWHNINRVINWAKSFNGNKVIDFVGTKKLNGKFYEYKISIQEFGSYVENFIFIVYDLVNNKIEYKLEKQPSDIDIAYINYRSWGIESSNRFIDYCKEKVLDEYPACPLFTRNKSGGRYSLGSRWIDFEKNNANVNEALKVLDEDAQRKAMFAGGYREELEERLEERQRIDYRNELGRISFNQAIIQDSGIFHIYNIKENEVDRIVRRIRELDYIEWVNKVESGKYDFSKVAMFGQPQAKYYNITGKIKDT